MKRKIRNSIWLYPLYILMSILPEVSQSQISFERINATDGLSDNQAICIHQDKEGFIWIGTMTGLNRYDGKSIKTFTQSASNNNALFSQRIGAIHEDNYGNLWLEGFGGVVQLFNKANHSVVNFPISFGEYPKSANYSIFLHDDGFAVLAFKGIGVFVLNLKSPDYNLIGKYLFDDEFLEHDTYIISIYATDENNIWLNTRSGPVYLKIDQISGEAKFIYLSESIAGNEARAQHYYKDSTLYFSVEGQGLLTCNIKDGTKNLKKEIDGINLGEITSISGNGDTIWISTRNDGVLSYSSQNQHLLSHTNLYNRQKLGYIDKVFIDSEKAIWFRAMNFQGIFRYNPKNSQTHFFPCSFEKSERLDKKNILIFFNEDPKGNIWMGTRQDGIVYYDRKQDSVKKILNNPKDSKSLISNRLLSFCIDKSENIWIGTQFGIAKTNIKEKQFEALEPNPEPQFEFDNKTDALFNDSYGNVWCGTYSGAIYVYDSQLKEKYVFSKETNRNGFVNSLYFCFYEDSKGRLWMGSKGDGLFFIDLKKYHNNLQNAKFTRFLPDESNPYSIHGDEIYDIIEDSNKRLWIAMYGGGLDLVLEKDNQIRFMPYNQFLNPFCPFTIEYGRCLLQDKKGKIWYGGVNGLCNFSVDDNDNLPSNVDFYYFDQENQHTITYNDVKSLYEDDEGKVWIGTYGGGLNMYNPDDKSFEHFSYTEGLANNIVYATINDLSGDLWISTKNGLSKYIREKNKFITYTVSEGLLTNEFTEAKTFMFNGKLFFGTIRGVSYFNPLKLNLQQNLPEILFTDLLISNKIQDVGTIGSLKKDINLADKIRLNYNQNNFSITYSTTDFQKQNRHRFEYKLENFDEEWIQTRNDQFITYTNIPPGKYTLKLRLISGANDQLFKQKALIVQINPPIWKTQWAYFIYFLFFTGLLLFSFNILRRFDTLRNSLRLEKEITDFKLKFFTNISHELRTPLTLIISPIKEILGGNNFDEKDKGLLQIAFHNANSLLKLVNEILDFRKIQTRNMSLKVSENEIVSFFRMITDDFSFVAEQKNIRYEQFVNVSERKLWFDPEKIERVIVNLLTNAFKFTPSGGKIIINLVVDPNKFSITIEDTGIGFDITKRDIIFNRFSRIENTSQSLFSQGAGIGLSLVEEFVKIHKGHIDVNSEKGKGTKFIISIPGNRNSYSDSELVHSDWEVGTESNYYINRFLLKKQTLNNNVKSKVSHTILLVEDNDELRSLIAQKLCTYYNIEIAENGKLGLQVTSTLDVDLIVTDLLMPEMDGIEMTKELKGNFSTCHIPVIMLTAKSAAENKIEGYETGADDYIVKPFDFDVLIARINNLLEQRRVLKQKFSNDLEFESRQVAVDKKDQEFIDKVKNVILENIADGEFSLQNIYKELGYSKTVFFNKIKALTGLNPSQFVRTIKLKEAAKLLKTTDLNVSEVAFKIGYADINYFRNQFKKQFHKTPSEFMKG